MALVLAIGVSAADAQSLRTSDGPSEFPPSSFTGKQFVDSRGCVFVRAGFDGAVTWVPRVNRQRNVLCGFQPTFARAAPPQQTEVATAPPAEASPPARTVATTPRPTATARPAPPPTTTSTPTRVVKVPPARTTAPVVVAKPVPTAPTKPVRVQPAPRQTTATACPGASPISQQYLNSTRAVRCGPQGTHPGSYAVGAGAGTTAVARVTPPPKIAPPAGYKPAFDDGRLNPNRGQQTRTGFNQMRLVWTAGVPRRLVDKNSGRDVTSLFPGLRFPFISMQQQNRYVAQHGWPASSGGSTVSVSTKNTPSATVAAAPSTGAAPSGHRYVQVGAFTVARNADASAARLQQLGLPVRMGTYQRSGKTFRVVLAGPFSSGASLNNALTAARRAGFSDAFTRK